MIRSIWQLTVIRGNAMEWIVRLECRDKNRVLHERDVARIDRLTDVLRPEEVRAS